MKKLTIVYTREDWRCFAQIEGPFHIENLSPCGVFMLIIAEDRTNVKFEVEIDYHMDDTTRNIITSEETDFHKRAHELIYHIAEEHLLNYLLDDNAKILNGDIMVREMSAAVTKLALDIAKEHDSYEEYTNPVVIIGDNHSPDSDEPVDVNEQTVKE